MKNLILPLLCFCAVLPLSGQSRIETGVMESDILGREKNYSVYLPDGYDNSGRDYPVLYLLHGAGDDHLNGWIQRGNMKHITDRLAAEGMILPMVIVMPDTSGDPGSDAGKNRGYFNRADYRYEDHFFEEFMPYIEKTYRIRSGKGSRAVAGLSMGGGGAMVYALHRPDLFGSSCPMSGLLGDSRRRHVADQDSDYRRSILDNDPQNIIRGASAEQLDGFRTVRWYIDCGDDDFLAESNVEMYLLMRENNIPMQFRMRDGVHSWEYWQQSLNEILRFVSTGYAE